MTKATTELKQVKLQFKKTEVTTLNNAVNKNEFEILLDEKETQIKEFLEIINAKDTQLSSERPCCTVCMLDIDENKHWIAFYTCGHRTCSECYKDLPLTAENTKLCPICNNIISVGVPLVDI